MVKESRRDCIYSNYGLQSVGRDKRLMLTRASRRDGTYSNYGLQSVGSDKRLMLTRANPVGMGHIVTTDFSPLVENRQSIR